MAPREQLRSLAQPLCFLRDMLGLLMDLELPRAVLHPLGKPMGAWGSQCQRSFGGEGNRGESSLMEVETPPSSRERFAGAGGSAAPCCTASQPALFTLWTHPTHPNHSQGE